MGKVYAASNAKKSRRFHPAYVGWFLLGLLLPFVGFCLFLYGLDHHRSWRRPLMWGVIVGVVATIAFYVFYAFYYAGFVWPVMRPVVYHDGASILLY